MAFANLQSERKQRNKEGQIISPTRTLHTVNKRGEFMFMPERQASVPYSINTI